MDTIDHITKPQGESLVSRLVAELRAMRAKGAGATPAAAAHSHAIEKLISTTPAENFRDALFQLQLGALLLATTSDFDDDMSIGVDAVNQAARFLETTFDAELLAGGRASQAA